MLIHNWWPVLKRSAALWCVYVTLLLQIAENAVPYIADRLPWWVPIVILVLAPLFRIISQGGLDADQQDSADKAR